MESLHVGKANKRAKHKRKRILPNYKLAKAQITSESTPQEIKSILYHASNITLEAFVNATGTLACDFFETYNPHMQTEIAKVPKFIKKRLYEHIEGYIRTHDREDSEIMRLVAQDMGCEIYHHANRTTKLCAYKNNLRYARVPMGAACGFCLMLASKGFAYHTRTSAGEDKGHYHTNCHCKIIAGDENTSIEGYDPKGITSRMCDIAKSLNIDFDWGDYIKHPHIQRLIQQELIVRDPTWVLTGKVPEVTFENELARKHVHPHEIAQARRLSEHGITCVFQVDYEVDEKTRGTAHQRIIGKPDLAGGGELKLLTSASKESTIISHLKNANNKKGINRVYFDNTQNSAMSDLEIARIIEMHLGDKKCENIKSVGLVTHNRNLRIFNK